MYIVQVHWFFFTCKYLWTLCFYKVFFFLKKGGVISIYLYYTEFLNKIWISFEYLTWCQSVQLFDFQTMAIWLGDKIKLKDTSKTGIISAY